MNINNDPLIMYLQKEAMGLEDNESDMELGQQEEPMADKKECAYDQSKERTGDWRNVLTSSFSNKTGVTNKFMEKDHDYAAGVVNRILALK